MRRKEAGAKESEERWKQLCVTLLLFLTTTEPGTTRRFYFGGNIYKGWSTVPEQYKAPGFSRPWSSRHTIRIFTFRF